MKAVYAVSMVMLFYVHTIFCGFFDGKWSELSSPHISSYGFENISGKGEYIWSKTDYEVRCFNIKTNEIKMWSNHELDPLVIEDAVFFPLDSGKMALISDIGISTFDGSMWTFIDTPDELHGTTFDKSGTMWSIFEIDSNEKSYYKVYYFKDSQWFEAPFNDRITDDIILINADSNDKIWLTGANQVSCYNKLTDSMSFFPSDRMKYTLQDPSGNVWFYNDSSLYSTSDSGLVQKYRVYYTLNLLQIDSNGDLWLVYKNDRYQIVKVDLKSSQEIWRFNTATPICALHSSACGVFTYANSNLLYFKNNDTTATTVNIDSLLCSSCPNVQLSGSGSSLFRKDGSHLYMIDDFHSSELLVERVGNRCSLIPLPPESNVTSMYERSDRTLMAGLCSKNCGLYTFNGLTWVLYPGTEGMRIEDLFEDSKGKIWGLFGDKIIRQTQTGWELIDTSNSNLPQPIRNIGGGYSFVEDSEHAIWTVFDSSVARTFDGYNWDTYTYDDFNLHSHSNQILLYTDRNKNVQLLLCNTVDTSKYITRATFKENQWHFEKISFPGETYSYCQDSRGVIYYTSYNNVAQLFYYDTIKSSWIALEEPVIPYYLEHFIADDNMGKIYFRDQSGQIIIFEYVNTKVNKQNSPVCQKSTVQTHFLTSNKIAVDFSLDKPGTITLSVYSTDGKLVKTLYNGFYQKGSHWNVYDFKCAKGMYFIQLKTADKSLMSRVIVK